jgi:hypothetical protein
MPNQPLQPPSGKPQIIGIILLLTFSACVDPCANDVLNELRSPDGRLKVVVFQRDCGATTGFSTQVSIIPSTQELLTSPTRFRSTPSGNVFVADTNHGAAPSGRGGGPIVKVEWLAPTRLKISYDHRARVFSSATSLDGVNVNYVAEEPPKNPLQPPSGGGF